MFAEAAEEKSIVLMKDANHARHVRKRFEVFEYCVSFYRRSSPLKNVV